MAVFRDKVKLEKSLKDVEKEAKEEEISLQKQIQMLKAKKRMTSTQPLRNFHAMAQQFNRTSLLLRFYSHASQVQQCTNSEQQDRQGNSTTHTTTRVNCFATVSPPQASSSTKKLAISDFTHKPPAGTFYLHPKVPFVYVRVYIVVTYSYLQRDRVMKDLGSALGSINLDSDCDDDSDNNGASDLSSLD